MVEFLLVKLGVAAVFQFFHGLIYTYVTGRQLEQAESAAKEVDSAEK